MLSFLNEINDKGLACLGAGFAMFAVFGIGLGQGLANSKAIEGIARNPETMSKLRTQFIIGAALTESGAIYCLIVAILLIFVAA